MYCQHFIQYGNPVNKMESFHSFSSDIANALINAYKPVVTVGQPSKRSSIDKSATGPNKEAAVATPCNDICYDQVGHWPEAVYQAYLFMYQVFKVSSFIMSFERKKLFQELPCKIDRFYHNIYQLF